MRAFTATLATETNSFAPLPTGLSAFRQPGHYFKAGTHPPEPTALSDWMLAKVRERARRDGWTLAEGMMAFAERAGVTTREVLALRRAMTMSGLGGLPTPLGDCALVETAGVKIVLATLRTQAFGTDLFTGLGVDLRQQRIVVVKSSQHFHAAYAPIASSVVYVDAPGSCSGRLDALVYRKIQRPKWPLDGA